MFDNRAPRVKTPPSEGRGVAVPVPAAALPDGYRVDEYFVGGIATSFASIDEPADGRCLAEPR